jgi:hypothetical protein
LKITTRQLRRIIKEEKARLDEGASVTAVDRLNDAMDRYVSSYLDRTHAAPLDVLEALREEVEGYIEFKSSEFLP